MQTDFKRGEVVYFQGGKEEATVYLILSAIKHRRSPPINPVFGSDPSAYGWREYVYTMRVLSETGEILDLFDYHPLYFHRMFENE